jgi:ribonucleotide monophosphatase NagD (HAD superfamily)
MILFVNLLITMSLSVLFLIVPTVVVAYQEGREISISLDSAEFIPLGEKGNQVNVFSNYTVNDPSFVNQKINSVMKVYATNGTLIKTSSSADGFIVNQTGSQRHVTTITNNTLQNVIAVVQYTDLPKTLPLSDPLQVDLNLTQVPALSETESEIAALT